MPQSSHYFSLFLHSPAIVLTDSDEHAHYFDTPAINYCTKLKYQSINQLTCRLLVLVNVKFCCKWKCTGRQVSLLRMLLSEGCISGGKGGFSFILVSGFSSAGSIASLGFDATGYSPHDIHPSGLKPCYHPVSISTALILSSFFSPDSPNLTQSRSSVIDYHPTG